MFWGISDGALGRSSFRNVIISFRMIVASARLNGEVSRACLSFCVICVAWRMLIRSKRSAKDHRRRARSTAADYVILSSWFLDLFAITRLLGRSQTQGVQNLQLQKFKDKKIF